MIIALEGTFSQTLKGVEIEWYSLWGLIDFGALMPQTGSIVLLLH
jgi:hypothetical protein